MITIALAQQLRAAGLVWQPQQHDHFALPDSDLEQQIFVISELIALIQLHQGAPVVAFHGASEWALDHVVVTEVVWLPSESQLRERLAAQLGPDAPLRLDRAPAGYRCTVGLGADVREFAAADAETAYALALIAALA